MILSHLLAQVEKSCEDAGIEAAHSSPMTDLAVSGGDVSCRIQIVMPPSRLFGFKKIVEVIEESDDKPDPPTVEPDPPTLGPVVPNPGTEPCLSKGEESPAEFSGNI